MQLINEHVQYSGAVHLAYSMSCVRRSRRRGCLVSDTALRTRTHCQHKPRPDMQYAGSSSSWAVVMLLASSAKEAWVSCCKPMPSCVVTCKPPPLPLLGRYSHSRQRISGSAVDGAPTPTEHGGAEARREQREETATRPGGQLARPVLLPVC
jgi:hypothetical protein